MTFHYTTKSIRQLWSNGNDLRYDIKVTSSATFSKKDMISNMSEMKNSIMKQLTNCRMFHYLKLLEIT